MSNDPDTRSRILDAAERRFAERGFTGTSVRDIVQSANVTNPMLYYYFGSKDELVRELIETRLGEMLATLKAHLSVCRTPEEVFEALALTICGDAEDRGPTIRFIIGFLLNGPSIGMEDRMRSHGEAVREAVIEALAAHLRAEDVPRERIARVVSLFHFGLVGELLARVSGATPTTEIGLHQASIPFYCQLLLTDDLTPASS